MVGDLLGPLEKENRITEQNYMLEPLSNTMKIVDMISICMQCKQCALLLNTL